MSKEEAERREAILQFIAELLSLAVTAWYLTPEHQRKTAILRLVEGSRRLCGRAALLTGQKAMTAELATGRQSYGLPYLLSRARDRAAAAYRRMTEA